MTTREKLLAGAMGLAAVGVVTYLAVNHVFLMPAADCEKQAADMADKLHHAQIEKGKESTYKAHLRELAGQSFGTEELHVLEEIRAAVTTILTLSGLSQQNLSLKPLTGARVPNVYKEIGWTVRARGKLSQVVSFLFLMSKETHLHRVDNVVVTPVPNSTDVELQVKYATLILETPSGEKLVTDEVPAVLEATLLETPERHQYEVVATRDLFRPYIPAQPKPPEAPPRGPVERPTPPSPEGRVRIVGLPTWGGKAEVLVTGAGGVVKNLAIGDELGGGKIVMVDYRPLPLPKNPQILSQSRVVFVVGSEYYAIELGQSLADKRPLGPDEVPAGLPKLAKPAPAAPETPAAPQNPAAQAKE
jgi:hypothetical protein